MAQLISRKLQDAIDNYYGEEPTDIQFLRFYANLAIRALFYADGQGVLPDAVLSQLLRQAYAAEQAFVEEEKKELEKKNEDS